MNNGDIPENVFRYVASHPADARGGVRYIEQESDAKLRANWESYLNIIPPEEVQEIKGRATFQRFHRTSGDIDREARKCAAAERIGTAARVQRLELLRQQIHLDRPVPYDHHDWSEFDVDSDHLISFEKYTSQSKPHKGTGIVTKLLSTTGAANSTTWLSQALAEVEPRALVRIRADPFLWGPSKTYPMYMEKMVVYGQPLDWDRISALQEDEHGIWYNDQGWGPGEYTEYVWAPRDDGIHFIAEEIPPLHTSGLSASRYLHAIYSHQEKSMSHFDGAIRIMAPEEQKDRRKSHVRNAGKVGVRAKVFRIDGLLARNHFSTIAKSFFVWNQDADRYFDHDVAATPTGGTDHA